MGFLRKCCLSFALVTLSGVSVANSSEGENSLTFSSLYFQQSDQQQDIRGLMSFGKDMAGLRGTGLDWATDQWGGSELNRAGLFLFSELVFGTVMDQSFQTALHEQGHGSRFASVGLGYRFNTGDDEFFGYYFSNFGDFEGFTQTTGVTYFALDDRVQDFINSKGGNNYRNLIISAAGINAEMTYADYLQDQMYFEGIHLSQGLGLIMGKTSALNYQYDDNLGNDLRSIEDQYQLLNIHVDVGDMDQANILAVLLSGSTWRYLAGAYDYTKTGDTRLESWEYFGFRVPDFSSYVTSRGLSMKMDTAYRLEEQLFLTLAVEHVYKGDSATEYTLGAYKEFPYMQGLTLQGHAIMGYGTGYGVESELRVTDTFSVFAGANYDELESLNGERYIVSLKDDLNEWSAFAGVRWFY